ncbi:MAG: hypothetical protein JNK05_26925 [Myxococcales bacterium]|nr:hypothetical protein [Myxococcales bacterium]
MSALRDGLVSVALVCAACTTSAPPTPPPEDVVFDVRRAIDVLSEVEDPIDPCGPAVCGPSERCGPTVDAGLGSGNGVDDNCNGQVDEGCLCTQGSMRACFPGASDRRGVGRCRDGMMTCTELGLWSDCVGAVSPTEEVCNGQDDDCDGMVDEGLEGCASSLQCPAFLAVQPLRELTVDGATIDRTASAFRWTLECPSEITTCPSIVDPMGRTMRVLLSQSGRYALRVEVTRADGSRGECRVPVYVDGAGMRVELSWDTQGGTNSAGADLDLHVAVIDRLRTRPSTWFSEDDCYYATCKAPGGVVRWARDATDTRFAPTMDVARCENAPPPWGERFRTAGRCWNPRLDTDTTQCDPAVRDPRDPRYCFVENVSVDVPPEDVTFRVAVNFYRDHGTCSDADARNDVSRPHLFVYCGAGVRAELGAVDSGGLVSMRCRDNPSVGSANWTWLAADVRFVTNACGVRDCVVTTLNARRLSVPFCDQVTESSDLCRDRDFRLFVRRAGARPVDAELPES